MSVMKMVGCFKTARSGRNVKSTSSISSQGSVNEYYRNLLQQFANHCQTSNRDVTDPDWLVYQRNEQNIEFSYKNNNQEKSKTSQVITSVPHLQSSEIIEIGSVAGTENRYLELISAEWRNTKVSLKRHAFKGCEDAIKADIEILSEIRHSNILLLMATTHTDQHGLVSIFEPVECTLHNYIHVQGERMNIQGTIQIGIKLAEVLKYCHMRGYVHGAISSHCVYFTSDATVKLGGWELAREAEKVHIEHDYEKYLRIEIDKWQAPETSYGLYCNKKSDVYCLMLLLWEMCTGCIPCDGNDRSDSMEPEYVTRNCNVNLRNVPSLLRNLLEIGLQVDEAKRTLDMDKIGRELHRLLVIHEYEKHSVNECETNNNDSLYDILNIKTSSPMSSANIKENEKSFIERKSHSSMTKSKDAIQFLTPEKKSRNRSLISKIEKTDMPAINNDISNPVTKAKTSECTNCAAILNIMQDIDEESNARDNIKRLKQLIANRRERFFLGSDLSPSSVKTNSEVTSTFSLKKSTSFDYIPCKPANHTTAIEPRFNKSLNEYDENTLKRSCTLQRKTPYLTMPASIKDAIIQRQVLHSDTKSFYESTLWRKEKEICLSRMGRDNKEREKPSPLESVNGLSTIGENKMQYLESDDITHIDGIYTVEAKDNDIEDTEESKNVKNMPIKLSTAANKSIQDLKNALERATEIIRSITPTRINDLDFDEKQEIVFEDQDDNREILVIDKSSGNKSFSDNKKYMNRYANTEYIEAEEHKKNFNQTPVNDKLNSLTLALMKKRSQKLTQNNAVNEQSTDSQEIDRNKTVFTKHNTSMRQQTVADFEVDEIDEERYVNVPISLNSTSAIDSHIYLPKSMKTDCPIKIVCKNDSQSSRCTTEDLYIDDELEGSNLNYNLVLLGDDYEYLFDATALCDQRRQITEL